MDFIEKNDIVIFNYSLKFLNGILYDKNPQDSPAQVKIGTKKFINGIEKTLIGMRIGDVKTKKINFKDAFGAKRKDLITTIPIGVIPKHINKAVGQKIEISIPNAPPFKGEIIAINTENIILDSNPIQAGKDFLLFIEVLDIISDKT